MNKVEGYIIQIVIVLIEVDEP